MDFILYTLAFIIGALSYALLFSRAKYPVDEMVITNLHLGKRVIIAIDNEAHIFQMEDNKLKVTMGIADFSPTPYDPNKELEEFLHELELNSMGNSGSDKSSSDSEPSV